MRILTQEEKFKRLFAKNVKRYCENKEWLFSWREMRRLRQLLKMNIANGEPEKVEVFSFTYGSLEFDAVGDSTRIESIMGKVLLDTEDFDDLRRYCESQYL